MKKTIIGAALLALAGQAGAATVSLDMLAYNQRASSGTLSTLKWAGPSSSALWTCATYTSTNPCINPANTNLANAGIVPSTAVWSWDTVTGVLSMTGTFDAASTMSSSGSAAASMVIGDKVTNLVLDTVNHTTTAASYSCAEGNFLSTVGANGCLNISLGDDGVLQSSAAYNVGGNANCVVRTIGGDDVSTGNVRTLANTAGGGGCEAGDGAFNMWTVVSNTLSPDGLSGQLIISNGIPTSASGTAYMTFQAAVPVPAAAWLLAPAVLAAGRFSRRRKAA